MREAEGKKEAVRLEDPKGIKIAASNLIVILRKIKNSQGNVRKFAAKPIPTERDRIIVDIHWA